MPSSRNLRSPVVHLPRVICQSTIAIDDAPRFDVAAFGIDPVNELAFDADQWVDLSRDIARASGSMLLMTLPLVILLSIAYAWLWDGDNLRSGFQNFTELRSFIPAIVIGIPLHELLHAFGWLLAGHHALKDIKFGFYIRTLSPYAHLRIPTPASVYRTGTFLPALILGFLPYTYALVSGNGWLASFGLFFILAAAGDLFVLWTLRGIDGAFSVLDHPSRVGCYVSREVPSVGG
ncbi:MAG: DUF3267 domain-containing protein [Chloroflexi bacterium]|nr:DUF3267 domain-containing protein [Chloroflexota bacterium]